jgi:hypothetical protein
MPFSKTSSLIYGQIPTNHLKDFTVMKKVYLFFKKQAIIHFFYPLSLNCNLAYAIFYLGSTSMAGVATTKHENGNSQVGLSLRNSTMAHCVGFRSSTQPTGLR